MLVSLSAGKLMTKRAALEMWVTLQIMLETLRVNGCYAFSQTKQTIW